MAVAEEAENLKQWAKEAKERLEAFRKWTKEKGKREALENAERDMQREAVLALASQLPGFDSK